MSRRSLLTPAEQAGLLAFPTTEQEFIRHYTFSEPDLSVIGQRRGKHNRGAALLERRRSFEEPGQGSGLRKAQARDALLRVV